MLNIIPVYNICDLFAGMPMSQFQVFYYDYVGGVCVNTGRLKFNYQIKTHFKDGDELLVQPKFGK